MYCATVAAMKDGMGATVEKPPPDTMSAPVAVEATISVPPVMHWYVPLQMGALGLLDVGVCTWVAPTARRLVPPTRGGRAHGQGIITNKE
jgi:hypothetical protein